MRSPGLRILSALGRPSCLKALTLMYRLRPLKLTTSRGFGLRAILTLERKPASPGRALLTAPRIRASASSALRTVSSSGGMPLRLSQPSVLVENFGGALFHVHDTPSVMVWRISSERPGVASQASLYGER